MYVTIETIQKAQQGDKTALEEILSALEPLIQKNIRSLGIERSAREDLAQDARLAVMEALPRFTPNAGRSLVSFMEHRIRGAIINSSGTYEYGFTLPQDVTVDYLKAVSSTETLTEAREYAVSQGMSAHRFDSAHAAMNGVLGVRESGDSDDEDGRSVQVPSSSFEGSLVENLVVQDAVAALPDRERQIVTLAFGLDGGKELVDREIADIMGIDRSRVNRIKKRAMSMLEEALKEEV